MNNKKTKILKQKRILCVSFCLCVLCFVLSVFSICLLTVNSIFLARVDSAILANGLSAPQHSTYFVILLDGLDLIGGPPGVALPEFVVVVTVEFVVPIESPPVKLLLRSDDVVVVDNRPLALPLRDESLSDFFGQSKNRKKKQIRLKSRYF